MNDYGSILVYEDMKHELYHKNRKELMINKTVNIDYLT